MPDHTPRVPPEAVKAAVSATRSTEPWCELAISAALPFLRADWEQEVRGRLEAEIDRIDQELAELEPIHNPPGRGIGFSKEAAYAAGLEIRRTCFEQARDAALTNREETPNA